MERKNYWGTQPSFIILKYCCWLLYIITNVPNKAFGQSETYNQNYNKNHFIQMKSPNVAMMERFETFKVDYFNGLPEISIPLFEIQTRGFSVPISLQYHSSGVKVADVASWVGLGWNLTGQFQVGRIVKGGPDEESFLNPNFNFFTPNDVAPNTMLGYHKLRALMPAHEGTNLFPPNDGEPDIFRYQLINKSGSFRYLKNAVPIIIPYAPILVKSQYVNLSTFNGFKITDESGINYSFGKSNAGTTNYFERTTSTEGGRQGFYTSSWLITDIVDKQNNDSIQYEYYPKKDVSLFSGYGTTITVLDQYTKYNEALPTLGENITTFPSRGANCEQHLLKSINFENGKIEYVLSAGNRSDLNIQSLAQVKIFKKEFSSYELVKTVIFHQSYFNTEDNEGRLKLDSIKIITPLGDKQVFKFEYNESKVMPKKSSLAMDYWGYYNEATNNVTGIPDTTIDYTNSSNNRLTIGDAGKGRKPDSIAVQVGMLKKITYPTGGFTNYEYESNKISQHGQILLGGGVRIRQIKSYAASGAVPIVRTFKYGQQAGDESGFGFVNANTQFNFLPSTMLGEHYIWPPGTLSATLGYTYRIRSFTNVMSYDQNDYDNSNVVYPFVTEYIGDGINNSGKNTYEFTFSSDRLQSGFMMVRPISISTHWLRGQLTRKKSYKVENGLDSLIAEEVNIFSEIKPSTYPDAGVLVGTIVSKSGSMEESKNYVTYTYPYLSSFYTLTTSAYLPTYKSNIKYFSNSSPVESKSFYKYDADLNVSESKEISSSKDTVYTFSKYVASYADVYGPGNFVYLLKNLNLLNLPIEQYIGVKRPLELKPLITSGILHVYNDTKPTLKEVYKLETEERLTDFSESSLSYNVLNFDNRYRKDLEFTVYNSNNKIEEIHKVDGKIVSYQWGKYPLGPVVEIINARNAVEVKNMGTGSTQLNVAATAGSFREFTFTVGYTGNAKLVLYQGTFLSSSSTMYIRYELTGPVNQSGSVCMNNNPNSGCYSGLESAKTANLIGLSPGTYKIKVICDTTVPNSSVSLGFDYPTEITYTADGKEFFYEGFETDQSLINVNSFAGRGCYIGDYTVQFNPTTGSNYVIDYRYLLSNKWIFVKKPYVSGMTLSEGGAIDEIRIYPTNSQMTTYTYDKVAGMTSKIDHSGKAEIYQYDNLQRLIRILDQDHNLLKTFDYNYINK